MSRYDDDAIDRAARAHARHLSRNGFIPMEPSGYDSERVGDVVYLRNCNGVMARYKVMPGGSVRRIKEPHEV